LAGCNRHGCEFGFVLSHSTGIGVDVGHQSPILIRR
jgi:hypothetical protein